MRLIVKEKIISLTGKYYIKDKEDNDVYLVKGSFSIPKKFRIYDMHNKEIIMIKKKLFRIFATWDFYIGNKVICRAKRKFSFKPKYEINGSAGSYTISGSIFAWDFVIKKEEQEIASIFKKITLYRDSYIIDVENENEMPIILAIAIMFDFVHHRHNSN